MFRFKFFIPFFAVLSSVAVFGFAVSTFQDGRGRKVKRVKRPVFTERDSEGIFFNNLFEEGLVGPRPTADEIRNRQSLAKRKPDVGTPDQSPGSASFAWSKFIERDVIEDEVKLLQQQLTKKVTTPVRFKTDYGSVHQSFGALSMLFAIISEYDSDVRWKTDARAAQSAFARAAVNSRVGSQQAYQGAKLRLQDLTEMVRGARFNEKPPTAPQVDWSNVVDRGTLMEMLEVSFSETLKPSTASKAEMVKNAEDILHQANLVAAIGQVLTKYGMEESDEEGYAQYAIEKSNAAKELSLAIKTNDYANAASAANAIGQSCSNCHDEWR